MTGGTLLDGVDCTGLGAQALVELFYKLVLVDVARRSAVPLCQFVHG